MLNSAHPGSDLIIAAILIFFAIGVSLLFFAFLLSLTTAMGKKQWLWGAAMIISGPIAAIPYCLCHWASARYPAKLSLIGLSIIIPPILIFFWLKSATS